jgi:hypothetical protein
MNDNRENPNRQSSTDVSLYDRLLARTEILLESGRISLEDALHEAAEELSSLGDYTRGQAHRIAAFVKRDVLHAADRAAEASTRVQENSQEGEKAEHFTSVVRDAIDPQRVVTGAQSFFSRLVTGAAMTLSEWGERLERSLEFKTGEITSPGSLTCKNCGEIIKLKQTVEIPPCPRCGQTSFRKSY